MSVITDTVQVAVDQVLWESCADSGESSIESVAILSREDTIKDSLLKVLRIV